jgi:hypothetical protein
VIIGLRGPEWVSGSGSKSREELSEIELMRVHVKNDGDGGFDDTSGPDPSKSEKARKSQENENRNPHAENRGDISGVDSADFPRKSSRVGKSPQTKSKPSNRQEESVYGQFRKSGFPR